MSSEVRLGLNDSKCNCRPFASKSDFPEFARPQSFERHHSRRTRPHSHRTHRSLFECRRAGQAAVPQSRHAVSGLNGLIISSTDCRPSEGYEWCEQKYGKSWGEAVSECWKLMHVSASRKSQVQDFSERDDDVERFLAEQNGPPGYVK